MFLEVIDPFKISFNLIIGHETSDKTDWDLLENI